MSRLSGIKKCSIADIFTLIGALFGCFAIYSLLTSNGDITLGTSFIILALIMDGLDGAAARKFGTKHEYGVHLDSLADALSFCLAPAVLIFTVFFPGEVLSLQGLLTIVVLLLVVSLGWARLYKFSTEGHKLKNFSGLPTPANAFLIVIVCHLLGNVWYASLPLLLVGALLQITPVAYPKVKGKVAVVLVIAIGLSFMVLLTPKLVSISTETYATYQVITFLGFVIILAYVLGGPLFERRSGKRSHGA